MTDRQQTPQTAAPADLIDLAPSQAWINAGTEDYPHPQQAGVAVVSGSEPSLASATRSLHWSRLRAAALFICVIAGAFLIFSLVDQRSWNSRFIIAGAVRILIPMLSFVVLNLPLAWTTARLRLVEYFLFIGLMLANVITEYILGVTYEDRGDVAALVATEKNTILRMILLMVIYGMWIPNDPKHAARVILTIALGPILLLVLLMEHPSSTNVSAALQNTPLAWTNLFSVLAGAAVSIYGAYLLNSMRSELHEAKRMGQYHLHDKLGGGGMGDVYYAEHQLLKRPCALKLIKSDMAKDPIAQARFEREVRSAASLSHPNVIAIYDYGHTDDGSFYYVMEYLPGMSLGQLVHDFGPLPPGRAIYLMRQLCAGLVEAHALGLVHRDLKPANIHIAIRGGEFDVVKVLDFGLVKVTQDPAAPQLTADLTVSGTPLFMSPEQATADRDLDARSDIYSIGAIAYFTVTGEPPFKGTSPMEIMISHARDPVVPPSQLVEGIPEDLERVILKCLAKKPDDRYQSVKDLMRAFDACQAAGSWSLHRAEAWWLNQADLAQAAAPAPEDQPQNATAEGT